MNDKFVNTTRNTSDLQIHQSDQQLQVLNTRQIQALEILSMSTLELSDFIQEEELSNPLVELETMARKEQHSSEDYVTAYSTEWSGLEGERNIISQVPIQHFDSLEEYLLEQIPETELSQREVEILRFYIQCIDPQTGYFMNETCEQGYKAGFSEKEYQWAFWKIRSMDPPGVGAENLKDCLMLQLHRRGIADTVLEKLIKDHLEELAAGHMNTITRKLKIRTEKVQEYLSLIQSLNPRPVQNFGESQTIYIVPDMIAEYTDSKWQVSFVGIRQSMIHLNQTYLKMAKEATDPEVAEYFNEKIKRAREIMEAVSQREKTLLKLAEYLLTIQKDFALGNGDKKTLTQKTMAEMLGVHASTINRGVKNKYIKVPAGVIELREFFQVKKEPSRLTKKKNGNVSEICLIAPTQVLIDQSKKVCQTHGKQVDVFLGSLPDAPDIVNSLSQRGAKVFISRKGTKQIIEDLKFPIVEIGLSVSDYIPLLKKAIAVKGQVAFFTYGMLSEDLKSLCSLLDLQAVYYSFYQMDQCRKIVEDAARAGVRLGIGGADTAAVARQIGLEHLTVENSEDSLLRAIETAEQVLQIQKEEARQKEKLKIQIERYEAVLNFTHDAIIAVNQSGEIDVLNSAAEEIVGRSRQQCLGRPIEQVIKKSEMMRVLHQGCTEVNQLMKINGIMVSTNRVPILVEGEVKGAVATFQDVRKIQNSEQNIRVKLHNKGLVAKYHFDDIVRTGSKMNAVVRMSEKFARSDATIVIQGETGTGKELFAQSIHNVSNRATGPFVAVNCGSLPRNILEAELFGYVEGAFTGASKGGKTGLFEMAHGGTIFLDEIGEMPLETQVQLLRVLQEKEIRRLGSDCQTPIDIRVITATNRDLIREIENKNFREDLYYRLNVLNIEVPPLRDRMEDVIPIAKSICKRCPNMDSFVEDMVIQILQNMPEYAWPGNVRELHNMVERIYVLASQGEEKAEIAFYINGYLRQAEITEKQRIIQTLDKNKMEMISTANELGMSRSTLWRKINKYNIDVR